MEFQFNDGGRKAAGYKGWTDDCVVRSISIGTGISYKQVYKDLFAIIKEKRKKSKSKLKRTSPFKGVFAEDYHDYILGKGFTWTPTMFIGQGCKVHMRKEELPDGILIVSLSGHMSVVINGVIHDTTDISRGGMRCVYGYYKKTK